MHFCTSAGEVSARMPPGKAATTTSLMRLRLLARYADCAHGAAAWVGGRTAHASAGVREALAGGRHDALPGSCSL